MRSSFLSLLGFLFGIFLAVLLFPLVEKHNEYCGSARLVDGDISASPVSENVMPIPASKFTPDTIDDRKSSVTTPSPRTIVKRNRPRFFATELGIRDKLLVAILTTPDTAPTMAVALNKSVAHHVNKLLFFSEPIMSPKPIVSSLNLITIPAGTPPNLQPLSILEYLADRGQSVTANYDWFFFAPDTVYIKAFKLFEFVSHISMGYRTQIGRLLTSDWNVRNAAQTTSCDFDGGVLLSRDMMMAVLKNLRGCLKQLSAHASPSENFARCIGGAVEYRVPCVQNWNGKSYKTTRLSTTASSIIDQLPTLGKQEWFNGSLTVFPVQSPTDLFHLHKYFCNQEIDQISALSRMIEMELSQPTWGAERIWPPGTPSTSRSRTRHELLKWDFFTESHIFENENLNFRPLSGVNRRDVDAVLQFAKRHLLSAHPRLGSTQLISGYRRFDPRRGMEYLIDLNLGMQNSSVQSQKRMYMLRPLNRVELVPLPYVTESTPVVVLLPVTAQDVDAASACLDTFIKTCLEVDENAVLVVIFVYNSATEQVASSKLISKIELIRKNRAVDGRKASLEFVRMRAPYLSHFAILDLMLGKIGQNSLYLLINPWTEISLDFLNRVRMKTIKGAQVFFPIPFVQYDPEVAPRQKSVNGTAKLIQIEVNKLEGRFDRNDFEIVALYGSDYRTQRHAADEEAIQNDRLDLLSLFLKSSYHIMRAVDPALKIRYHHKRCSPRADEAAQERCVQSRRESLGSKLQLAALLLEKNAL